MISKILVPVDFSEAAYNATEAAISMARLYDADLVFYFAESEAKIPNSIEETIQEKIKQLEAKFDLKGIDVVKVFKKGDFISSVLSYIAEQKIDLVVMGSHGVQGINDLFIGSNTLKMMRSVSCPLLIIKGKIKNMALNKIVFASNFDNSNFAPFRTLIKMLLPFNSEIHLLNIDTPGFFGDGNIIMEPAIDAFKTYAEENGFICHAYRKSHTIIEQGINEFITKIKPDLVVIPTNEKSALKRLFVSSIAEAVVNHANIPAMTMKV